MRIMDRYLFWTFLQFYMIVFTSVIGLYVVIDLFANADEFIKDDPGTVAFVVRVSKYYAIHSFEYLGRLSPMITMVAAMSALATLHRHNEIVALLAAGVPTWRMLAPIGAGLGVVIAVGLANREWVMPANSAFLQRSHDDVEGANNLGAANEIDRNQVLIRGQRAVQAKKKLDDARITLPGRGQDHVVEVSCEAAWNERHPETGELGWRLERPIPANPPEHELLVRLPDGGLFLRSSTTFQDMVRTKLWTMYASTGELIAELNSEDAKNPAELRAVVHQRIMQPIGNVLLVMLGLPFILQWNRNLFVGIAVAMGLAAAFFVVDVVSQYFAAFGYIDSTFAAWMPVFAFGPLAAGLMNRIST